MGSKIKIFFAMKRKNMTLGSIISLLIFYNIHFELI